MAFKRRSRIFKVLVTAENFKKNRSRKLVVETDDREQCNRELHGERIYFLNSFFSDVTCSILLFYKSNCNCKHRTTCNTHTPKCEPCQLSKSSTPFPTGSFRSDTNLISDTTFHTNLISMLDSAIMTAV